MEGYLTQLLTTMISQHPVLATIVAVLGVMRLIVVPVQTIVMTIVGATPSVRDDELARGFFNGKLWKGIVSFLEWISSVDSKKLK